MSTDERPAWTRNENSTLLWREDDATMNDPDHVTMRQAWRRLFNNAMPEKALESSVDTQLVCKRYPGNIVTFNSLPGHSEIRKVDRTEASTSTREPGGKVTFSCRKVESFDLGDTFQVLPDEQPGKRCLLVGNWYNNQSRDVPVTSVVPGDILYYKNPNGHLIEIGVVEEVLDSRDKPKP